MDEQKEFKKKQLNKDDYKKDEKVVGGIKKVLGAFAIVGASITTVLAAIAKSQNTKNE